MRAGFIEAEFFKWFFFYELTTILQKTAGYTRFFSLPVRLRNLGVSRKLYKIQFSPLIAPVFFSSDNCNGGPEALTALDRTLAGAALFRPSHVGLARPHWAKLAGEIAAD